MPGSQGEDQKRLLTDSVGMAELPLTCSGTEEISMFHTAIQGRIINKGLNTMNVQLEGPFRDGI